MFINPLGGELSYNLGLGRDGSVVRARHPAGIFAGHSGAAHQNILNGIVEHVAHVKHTGHVRRRNNNRIGFAVIRLRMEKIMLHPVGVPFVLHFGRIVFGG